MTEKKKNHEYCSTPVTYETIPLATLNTKKILELDTILSLVRRFLQSQNKRPLRPEIEKFEFSSTVQFLEDIFTRNAF